MEGPSYNEPFSSRKSEVMPLEQIDVMNKGLLEVTTQQIEIIRDSLKDLANRIEKEKPNTLVFLDISARIFGTPFLKYLSERMGKEAPKVKFFNDQDLKGRYLEGLALDEAVENELGDLKGRKVFFIDETYSSGKGAAALYEAKKILGGDIWYFALTQDPDPVFQDENHQIGISENAHAENIKNFSNDPHVVIYHNPIKNLFSRLASRWYVQDWQGTTIPMYRDVEELDEESENPKSKLPNANDYMQPPPGMTMDQYLLEATRKADALVRAIKDKIYEALKN